MMFDHLSHSVRTLIANLSSVDVLKNVQDAPKILKWRKTKIEEMQDLEKNDT